MNRLFNACPDEKLHLVQYHVSLWLNNWKQFQNVNFSIQYNLFRKLINLKWFVKNFVCQYSLLNIPILYAIVNTHIWVWVQFHKSLDQCDGMMNENINDNTYVYNATHIIENETIDYL